MSSEKSAGEFWLSQLEEHLRRGRYSPEATQRVTAVSTAFLTFLSKRHIGIEAAKPTDIKRYLLHALRHYRKRHGRDPKSLRAPKSFQWWRYSYTTGIYMLLRLAHGYWPPPSPAQSPTEIFHRDICERYDKWMDEVRGLSPETRSDRCAEARRFLTYLAERGSRQGLSDITVRDIDAYMISRAKSQRRTTLKRCAADLRSFLRYLHVTGWLNFDFSTAVITPRLYAFENIPSALRPEDIHAVLETTREDRSRKGRRDYAMLMLLSSYGLRAGEVTALQLGQVNWRSETLRIHHSKTGAYSELPLLPAVGTAILAYLRTGRPRVQAREIFIRDRAPYQPFRNGSSLYGMVRRRLTDAGITPRGKRGPHAFRHALAANLLRAAVPLKGIGDILGHRSTDSTSAYLKLATEELRAVSLEIPVEVGA
jgi:integrase/recombinase XerD